LLFAVPSSNRTCGEERFKVLMISSSNLTVRNLDSSLLGESAAVLTSCLWTFGSLLFTSAGRRIGSFSLNAYRTTIAIGLLCCAHIVLLGVVLPVASSAQWFWMGLSGIVGLGVGDLGLFAAYVAIGPRRAVLMMASSPIFAAIGAYLMRGETVSLWSLLGVAVTLAGIVVVLLEREEKVADAGGVKKNWGVLFGMIAAMGQGFGIVLSKQGMYADVNAVLNPLSAALIRVMLAACFVWLCAPLVGKLPELRRAVKDRVGVKFTFAGALVGPFAGMTISMVAITYTDAGVAQTLMSLMPVMIIPLVWVVYRERTSRRGMLGALVAVIGVAILFLI
jgi:drug/metabolite transporter (DMT)-like permease